jgi:hypothetical protein
MRSRFSFEAGEIMNILNEFAEAMAKLEHEKGISGGYEIPGKEPNPHYMSNSNWDAFLKAMPPEIKSQYGGGSGGELNPKKGCPPKMAAFVSSSRFVYQQSKDCPGFIFEEQLPTTIGGVANLDGYLPGKNRVVYVEVKCREPYGHTPPEKIKLVYKPVYVWLRKHMGRIFDCVMEDLDDQYMRTVFFAGRRAIEGFDIKQMICHMLGIAAKYLRTESVQDRIDFLYLIYDPSNLPLSDTTKAAVMEIYEQTKASASSLRPERMFGHIVDFLNDRATQKASDAHLSAMKGAFRFSLCSQFDYKEKLR